MNTKSTENPKSIILNESQLPNDESEEKNYVFLDFEDSFEYTTGEKPRMKRKRKDINLETKLQIISAVDKGDKNRSSVARDFQIPLTTLSTLLKNRHKIENSLYEGKLLTTRKRLRNGRHEKLDNELVKWFNERREKKLPVSPPILREKAEQIAAELGVSGFKCSNGWLQRLKERNQLIFDGAKRIKSYYVALNPKTDVLSDEEIEEEEEDLTLEITKDEDYFEPKPESYTEEVLELESDDNNEQTITSFKQDETIYQLHEYNIEYDEILGASQVNTVQENLTKSPARNIVIIKNDIITSSPVPQKSKFAEIPLLQIKQQAPINLPIQPNLKEYIEKNDGLPSKGAAMYALNILEKVLLCSDVECDAETRNAFQKIQQFTDKSYPKMVQLKINQFFK